jgi:iron complex transport system substrate-binding protein
MGPRRIVCLTEEPTETLYLLGESERIVGISGFTVRPPEARRDKPKVSAFISAKVDRILALRADLAIGFSDIQADIAQALIKAGVEVWIANHRSVEGILDYIRRLGAMVGRAGDAIALADRLQRGLEAIAAQAARLPRRPRVYFEEWDEPRISGIQWVAELVRIAGGDDIFPERAACALARDRILADDSRDHRPRAGDRVRLLVRKEVPAGAGGGPSRLAGRAGGTRRPAARDQVADHPAARPGGADRGRGRDRPADHRLGPRRDVSPLCSPAHRRVASVGR